MFKLLMNIVVLGVYGAACYFVWHKDVDAVIMLSLFGIFTNEVIKTLFPTVMILQGVKSNARQ